MPPPKKSQYPGNGIAGFMSRKYKTYLSPYLKSALQDVGLFTKEASEFTPSPPLSLEEENHQLVNCEKASIQLSLAFIIAKRATFSSLLYLLSFKNQLPSGS
jgi:hypothetical protein